MKEQYENNFIIGVLAGIVAGAMLLLGQFIAELYGQKYNILLMISIAIGLFIIMIFVIAWKNTKNKRGE